MTMNPYAELIKVTLAGFGFGPEPIRQVLIVAQAWADRAGEDGSFTSPQNASAVPALRVGFKRPDEEHLEIWMNGDLVASYNHDEHGWDGMQSAEKIVRMMAQAGGIEVEEF